MPPTIENRVCLPERLHMLRFRSCAPERMARRIEPADDGPDAGTDADAGMGTGVDADRDAPTSADCADVSVRLLPLDEAARCWVWARGGRGGPSGVLPVAPCPPAPAALRVTGAAVPAARRGGEASNSCSSAARNCAKSSVLDMSPKRGRAVHTAPFVGHLAADGALARGLPAAPTQYTRSTDIWRLSDPMAYRPYMYER